MMDNTIQSVLVDLKVVSMVEPNGKMCLYNGILYVEPTSLWLPFKRYLMSNNRYTMSQRIKQRIQELETLFSQNHIKDDWIKEEIMKLIEPLKNGIINLKDTYSNDSQMCANFDLMVSRINNINVIYLLKT
jgi:hypothetical protein